MDAEKLKAFSYSFGKGREEQRDKNKMDEERKELIKKRKKALFGSTEEEKSEDIKPIG